MSPSASKLKKKPRARLSRGGPGPDRSEAGAHSQRVEPANLPARLEDRGKADPPTGEYQDDPTNPDPPRVLEDGSEKNTAGEHRSDRKSTVSAAAKFLLCTVRDSADAFPPLKSVAGGICSLLENYERAKGNKQTIESLAPRIKSLGELLRSPVSEGDAREELRRKELERKLSGVHRDLTLLAGQGKVDGFLKSVGNTGKLGDLLEDIRDAMAEYQTSLQQDIYDKSCRLIESADLALLDRMHHVAGAGYRSGNRQGCLRGTRKDVLWQIESWLADDRDQRVFWLNGLAGTGKSTIAQTFAQTSFSDGKLGASFFCSRDFEDRSNIQNIFPTLAFQLAYRYPQFRKELLPALRGNPDIGCDSLCSQLETLIVDPFKTTQIPTLIIIDALDECKDEEPASAILSVLSRYADRIPRVKFFITGRPEPRIRTGFRLELLRPITEVLKLHDVERSLVDGDIKLFFETRLGDIAKTRSDCDLTENWPSSYDIDVLCKKAAGLFIYASTVVKFVASPFHSPTERLTLVVSLRHSTAHEGKSGIDLLYTQVLEQAFRNADSDEQELYSGFKQVVGAVLLVFYPLSRKTLSELFKNCTPSRISSTLRSLHSLLLVPTSEVDPIRSFHKSFPDFLTDPGRCKDERFFVSPSIHHIDILSSCLDLMEERLRRNICNLDGCPILSEVKDLPVRKETYIGSALEYACRFWTKHLVGIGRNGPHRLKRVRKLVDRFFTKHLLFWIEVLSLTGNLNSGVYALHDVDLWYLSTGVSCKWTNDSQRLILSNFDEIRHSPTKLYRCALPFCPSSSWLHDWHTAKSLQEVRVVAGRPDEWETTFRVISFDSYPEALAYQKDIVAAGLVSGDIVVLDPVTGFRRSVLSGHASGVTSLAFSLDGTLLVSGGGDRTIKLWDIQTGGVVKNFYASPHDVCSVSISPDAITIASGSHKDRICLWDVRTGRGPRIITISTKQRIVTCVDFLPDLSGLVSVSAGRFVQRWNLDGSKAGPQTSGRNVAFSLDGRRFVLCGEGAPTVRDSISRAVLTTLDSPGQGFSRCCFSPNGEFVAGAANATVYVWNIADTSQTSRLVGVFSHDSKISSLLYTTSLISAHSDGKVRFWQVGGDSPNPNATITKSMASVVPPRITQVTLRGEEGFALSTDSAGLVRLWDLSTGFSKVFPQTFQSAIDVVDARLVNGVLAIAFSEMPYLPLKISTWDVETGSNWTGPARRISLNDGHPSTSNDRTILFPGDFQRLRDRSTPMISRSGFSTPRRHSGDLDPPRPTRLSPSGPPYSSSVFEDSSRIRATVSEKDIHLPERFGKLDVQCDGRYLTATNRSGELFILDFLHLISRQGPASRLPAL